MLFLFSGFFSTIINICFVCLVFFGASSILSTYPSFNNFLDSKVINRFRKFMDKSIEVIEPRFSVTRVPLAGRAVKYQEIYSPYLVADVKYIDDSGEIEEGVFVWSLKDGEIVTNTLNWSTTKCLDDILSSKINTNNIYSIIYFINNIKNPTVDSITKESGIPIKEVACAIKNYEEEGLITVHNGIIRLSIKDPIIPKYPKTERSDLLSNSSFKDANKTNVYRCSYSANDLISFSEKAFGKRIKIKKHKIIYIPVYQITEELSDGSLLTRKVNSINGLDY